MSIDVKENEREIEREVDDVCPDFDEDCKCVKDHLSCFLGLWGIGTAKGKCPFIHPDN